MNFLQTLIILSLFFGLNESAIFNRYQPLHGKSMSYKGVKIEKLASFGMSRQMQQSAASAIQKYFHPRWFITGQDSQQIGDFMERKYGGNFFVGMFSGETDTAYTIVRRSPNYVLFRVANRMILIAKESSNPKLHNDLLL